MNCIILRASFEDRLVRDPSDGVRFAVASEVMGGLSV